jgi:hypothetical protein
LILERKITINGHSKKALCKPNIGYEGVGIEKF